MIELNRLGGDIKIDKFAPLAVVNHFEDHAMVTLGVIVAYS